MAASALTDPAAVAALAVQHLRDVCGTETAALYWWDDDQRVLLPLAVLDPRASGLHQVFHPGQGATGLAFSTSSAILTNNYPDGVQFPPAWKVADGLRAVAAVPLQAGGRTAGVLVVGQRGTGDVTEAHAAAMRVIGHEVAPMLHSMRALAHAQFRLAEVRQLTALIRDAAAAAEIAPVLQHICELSARMLGADFAVVAQLADGTGSADSAALATRPPLHARAAYGTRTAMADWDRGAIELQLPDGDAVRIDVPENSTDSMPLFGLESVRTALAIPLVTASGARAGVLLLGWRFPVDPSTQLVSLARTLAAAATSLLVREGTERALRASEALWRTTLDNAPVGICLVSLAGEFQLVNDAMTRILGYSEKELIGRNFTTITLPSYVPEKQELLRRLLARDVQSGTLQTQCIHADGHNVWTSISAQLIPGEDADGALFSVQLEDITFQHEQNEKLVHLATHDSLTGLANRRLFHAMLSGRVLARLPTVVALIDVPDLHGLEDRYGHLPAGEVVRDLAARLASVVSTIGEGAGNNGTDGAPGSQPAQECVARLGSDEFAVMFAAGSIDEETVVARLVAVLQAPVTVGGRTHTLSVHVGLAMSPDDGPSAQDLMHSADIALTEARREGRTARRHSIDLRQRVTHRERLTVDLREALRSGSLTLAYQPIIQAGTGILSAAEALARWHHPEFGPIPPDVFVALAEETGLMPDLTTWALGAALRACAGWQSVKPGVAAAVNLSASDLQNPATAETIAATLAEHSVAPALLELELTETTVMTDLVAAHSMLALLAELGVGLGIDDFGTGYSSLSYLQRLPMVTLKIDRSFVTTMLADSGNSAIVTMVLQLARTLGMGTVAEGVEDSATHERLTAMHCDRIQGYAIARPMPESEFLIWLP